MLNSQSFYINGALISSATYVVDARRMVTHNIGT